LRPEHSTFDPVVEYSINGVRVTESEYKYEHFRRIIASQREIDFQLGC
jgi:hypothetical protein